MTADTMPEQILVLPTEKLCVGTNSYLRGGRAACIDRFFPSSKCCSNCGHVMDKLPLSIREWDCPACLAHHDRDENASTNIEMIGQAMPRIVKASALATHGEMEALASASAEVKLLSMNRELNRCTHVHTHLKAAS